MTPPINHTYKTETLLVLLKPYNFSILKYKENVCLENDLTEAKI